MFAGLRDTGINTGGSSRRAPVVDAYWLVRRYRDCAGLAPALQRGGHVTQYGATRPASAGYLDAHR